MMFMILEIQLTKSLMISKAACKKNTPEIKIATPFYKPANNNTIISLIIIFMKLING